MRCYPCWMSFLWFYSWENSPTNWCSSLSVLSNNLSVLPNHLTFLPNSLSSPWSGLRSIRKHRELSIQRFSSFSNCLYNELCTCDRNIVLLWLNSLPQKLIDVVFFFAEPSLNSLRFISWFWHFLSRLWTLCCRAGFYTSIKYFICSMME